MKRIVIVFFLMFLCIAGVAYGNQAIIYGNSPCLSFSSDTVWVMSANAMTTTFASGVDAEIGRGTTDTDVTYIALRATDGTKIYIYTDGISLILSTTAP